MASFNSQFKSNKAKLAVIPLLGVVLIYLVFGSGDSPEDSIGAPAAPRTTGPTTNVVAESNELPADLASRTWPVKSLEEILQHDPFQTRTPYSPSPASIASLPFDAVQQQEQQEAEQERDRSRLVDRFSRKVPEMVLHSRHGTSAVIDGQTVREGDVLDGTARVVTIRPDGIIFELLESN